MTLNNEQLEVFKNRLLAEQKEIEKQLSELANPQSGGISRVAFPDFKNVAGSFDEDTDEVEEYEQRLAVHRHLSHRLAEIKTTLQNMQQGKYGWCDNCGEEIPLERLEANPAATTCVKCSK